MHSQWFLADLTTDAIDLLCYLSLKYSEKKCIRMYYIFGFCYVNDLRWNLLSLLEPDALNSVNTKANIVAGWKINMA